MVALQNGFSMSAEMLVDVMLARQTSRAHAASYDLERAAGAEENHLNSLAAESGGEVGEWRTHLETLIVAASWRRFTLGIQSGQIPDFSDSGDFRPKNTRWEGV